MTHVMLPRGGEEPHRLGPRHREGHGSTSGCSKTGSTKSVATGLSSTGKIFDSSEGIFVTIAQDQRPKSFFRGVEMADAHDLADVFLIHLDAQRGGDNAAGGQHGRPTRTNGAGPTTRIAADTAAATFGNASILCYSMGHSNPSAVPLKTTIRRRCAGFHLSRQHGAFRTVDSFQP